VTALSFLCAAARCGIAELFSGGLAHGKRVRALLATLHCRPCFTDEASCRVGAASTFLCGHLQIIRSRGPNPLKAARRFVPRLLNVILMFTTKSYIPALVTP
jgi:hypothetical protein